ncbi:hypothetical protein B0T21DRAFT_291198 [Apiosordaria backusii]|uniref:KOW domain-containing protein n=1 Tax=Apiosordaria backusii TaxID=314023 RepID=A0AA40EAA0_9PEZI|nr:hypothetical protein B0T21DRAFT_291198 [Apiosordaria backusii]
MDKILRRVAMAERQVTKRFKRKSQRKFQLEKKERNKEIGRYRQEVGEDMRQAIIARHEDLELGPLAPNRDTGKVNEFGNPYGTISVDRALLHSQLTPQQKEARCAWAGGAKSLCLAPGDRVVILEGPYKGKIVPIKSIKTNTMVLEMDEALKTNAKIPDYLREEGASPVEPIASAIPISAVRLVYPLPDPTTGHVRDVIIRELKPINITHDRPTRRSTFSRIVPGLNVKIPWPVVPPTQHFDHPEDTLRIDVEERTYVPTLLRPPMPEQVIDELRNRYGKFRTRHTEEYIAKIQAQEDEKKARKKSVDSMLQPVQEYNRKLRELRRERGQPVLTDEMLEKIGQVIAKNQTLRKLGAKVSAELEKRKKADEQLRKAVERLSIAEETAAATGETPVDQPKA